jgi:hypothetical protein
MNEPELTCLRCSAIEVDCDCKSGFQANPYDRITELEADFSVAQHMGLLKKVDELKAENAKLVKDFMTAYPEIIKLKAQLEAVKALPISGLSKEAQIILGMREAAIGDGEDGH